MIVCPLLNIFTNENDQIYRSKRKKMIRFKEAAFINRSLLLHKCLKVQKLNITFNYSSNSIEARLLDSWIHFALTRNVNQLYLDCTRCNPYRYKYKLDDIIFRCSSLTVLALKGCRIQLPVKVKLGSLKSLSFEHVRFEGGAINDLFSSCSILEDLSFSISFFRNNPDLVKLNSGVKTLKIEHGLFFENSTLLEINAPFIVFLKLIQSPLAKDYIIKRMESLCSASFVCCESRSCLEQVYTNFSNHEYLCHVKDLRMCSCYIQAMSSKKIPTQDCREKHIMDFISFDVTCLKIRTGLMKWELPGIAYILSHSPNVETLTIEVHSLYGKELNDNFQEGEYWNLQEQKFVNLLCSLKDVKIYNFMKNLNLLESKQMCTSDDFLAHLKTDMDFLKFLLKNSMAMDRMTITTFKKVNFGHHSENKKLKLLFQLTEELLAYPRASRAAQISFNDTLETNLQLANA